jgi:hypothetical protein
MGSIADTYKKKEVMRHEQWLACLDLDMKDLYSKGHMT